MTTGRRSSHPGIWAALVASGPILLAGCTGASLRHRAGQVSSPSTPQPATPVLLPEASVDEAPERETTSPATTVPTPSTPLLDAAIRQAQAIQQETLSVPVTPESTEPTVELAPIPDLPGLADVPPTVTTADDRPALSDASVVPTQPISPPGNVQVETKDEPIVSWKDALERVRILVQEHSGEPSEVWAVRKSLLEHLAIEEPPTALWTALLEALKSSDPSDDQPEKRGSRIREAVRMLEDLAPLEVTELKACRKVKGFGDYERFGSDEFRPGQSLILYCELAGLQYESHEGGFRSRLASHLELVPEQGGEPVWSQTLGTAEDVCRNRRRDYYVNYVFSLPRDLPVGSYVLRLTQSDLIAGRSGSRSIPISLRP